MTRRFKRHLVDCWCRVCARKWRTYGRRYAMGTVDDLMRLFPPVG